VTAAKCQCEHCVAGWLTSLLVGERRGVGAGRRC
jgi:hypothetical protein